MTDESDLDDDIGAVILRMLDYVAEIFGAASGYQAQQEQMTAEELRDVRSAELHLREAVRLLGG